MLCQCANSVMFPMKDCSLCLSSASNIHMLQLKVLNVDHPCQFYTGLHNFIILVQHMQTNLTSNRGKFCMKKDGSNATSRRNAATLIYVRLTLLFPESYNSVEQSAQKHSINSFSQLFHRSIT